MKRKALPLCGLALAVGFGSFSSGAQDLPPLTQWLPAEAVLAVESAEPLALLEPLLSPELAKVAMALATNQQQNAQFRQLQGVVTLLELQLGTDWRGGLRRLAGGALAFAADATGGTLLALETKDEKLLQQLEETARHWATAEATRQNRPDSVASREYKGATVWTLGTNEA